MSQQSDNEWAKRAIGLLEDAHAKARKSEPNEQKFQETLHTLKGCIRVVQKVRSATPLHAVQIMIERAVATESNEQAQNFTMWILAALHEITHDEAADIKTGSRN